MRVGGRKKSGEDGDGDEDGEIKLRDRAEEGTEQVPQIHAAHVKAAVAAAESASPAVGGIHPRVTELVIPGALLRIGEDLIGLVDLFELGLSRGVAGVQVGVELLGLLSVSLFQLLLAGPLADPQDFIVISFLFWHNVVAKSTELRFRLRRKLRPLPCSSSPHKS